MLTKRVHPEQVDFYFIQEFVIIKKLSTISFCNLPYYILIMIPKVGKIVPDSFGIDCKTYCVPLLIVL